MAQAELLQETTDIGGTPVIVEKRPEITGRDGVLRFIALSKQNGMERGKIMRYLSSRGLLTKEVLTPRTPSEKMNQRVRDAEKQGALRTVPLPEDPETPEVPQTVSASELALNRLYARDVGAADVIHQAPILGALGTPGYFAAQGLAVAQATGTDVPGLGKSGWRKEMEANLHAAEEDHMRGAGQFTSVKGWKVLGLEMAFDPLTWIPAAGSLARVGNKLVSSLGRRAFTINFSDAVAKGMTEGLIDDMAEETADFAVGVATYQARRAAAKEVLEEAQRIAGGIDKSARAARADVAIAGGEAAEGSLDAAAAISRKVDGEIAETVNTYFDDAVQMDMFGEQQLRLPNAFDTSQPQPSLGRKVVEDLNRLKDTAAGMTREQIARLGVQREAMLSNIGQRAGKGKETVYRVAQDKMRASIKTAVDDVAGNQNKIRETARNEVQTFFKNVMGRENIPSSSEASAVARLTTQQTLEWLEKIARDAPRAKTGAPTVKSIITKGPSIASPNRLGERMPMGFFVARMIDKWVPGKSNLLVGGMLRTANRLWGKDPVIRSLMLKTWPDMYARAGGAGGGEIGSAVFELENLSYVMANRINAAAKRLGMPYNKLGALMDEAYRAGDYSKIPDAVLRSDLQTASDSIAAISRKLMDAGVMDPDMLQTVQSQMGRYAHLSYSKHHVADWAKRIEGTAQWDAALQLFKKHFPEMSEDEIIGEMMYLVKNNRPASWGSELKIVTDEAVTNAPGGAVVEGLSPKFENLIRRKNIHPVIQDLFGIERDFVTNFQVTGAKMVYDLNMAGFDKKMIESGLRAGVFTVGKTSTNHMPITFPRIMSRPIYTSPEVHYAITGMESAAQQFGTWRFIVGMSSAVKFGKVGLSPPTIMRNALSIPPMMLNNGTAWELMAHPSLAKKSIQLATHVIKQKVARVLRQPQKVKPIPKFLEGEISELIRHNLVGTGALSGEINMWKAGISGVLQRQGLKPSALGGVSRGVGGGLNAAGELYMGLDDFAKITSYLAKQNQLTRWQTKMQKLGEQGQKDFTSYMLDVYGHPNVNKAAADFTKETIQHFPYTSPIGKELSMNPLVSPFASFAFEMPRTQAQTIRFAAREIGWAAKNPTSPLAVQVGAHAMQKVAGVFAAANVFTGAGMLLMNEADKDPDYEEAIREVVAAPWQKNSSLIWETHDDGTITLMDPGYSNPFSETTKMYVAAISRPGTLQERLMRFAAQLEEGFLGREIMVEGVLESVMNKRLGEGGWSGVLSDDGRKIAEDRTMGELAERLYHLFSATAPGAVTWADRFVRQTSDTGTRGFGVIKDKEPYYDIPTWMMATSFFGAPTAIRIDPKKATWFKFEGNLNDVKSTRKGFRSDYRNQPDTVATIDHYRKEWSDLNQEIIQNVHYAKVLGVPIGEIKRQLESGGQDAKLNRTAVALLLSERIVPFNIVYTTPMRFNN